MKRIISINLVSIILSLTVQAQCVPDVNFNQPGVYPIPDSLPCVERGVAYSEVIQIRIPASYSGFNIDSIRINAITGFPAGVSYSCNPPSCKFIPSATGCILVSGTTTDPAGDYDLILVATAYAFGIGLPIPDSLLAQNGYDLRLKVIEQGEPCHQAPEVTVSGRILSEMGDGVKTVTVNSTSISSPSDVTASDGSYSLTFNSGESPSITPSKSNDTSSNNGNTTLDILLIRRHVLNITLLDSPYKIIAADVNGNSSVTTTDILFIRSIILQITTTYPNGKLWAFVPSDYIFSDMHNPFPYPGERSYNNLSSNLTDQNFVGIKLGDVNNDWNPNIAKRGATGEVGFTLNNYEALPEQEIVVPVKVKDFKNVTGYQFTLSWNPEVLMLLEVNNQSLTGNYGMQKINEGFLTTSWDDEMAKGVDLKNDETAFELKFKVIGANGSSSEIKIGSVLTSSEAYNENLDLLSVKSINGEVKVGDTNSLNTQHSTPNTLSVQPNPFSNSTKIIFELPKDETVSIVIYDLLGKEVKRMKGEFKTGENKIDWAGDDESKKSLSGGFYHVRVMADNFETGVKVLLTR